MDSVRILIVDDDKEILDSVSQVLGNAGFETVVAENAEDALGKLIDNHPQLIISDIVMPGMNGYDFCRRMRSLVTYYVPFLFLSALGSPEARTIGLRMGADEYVAKPVVVEELLFKVRDLLEKRS